MTILIADTEANGLRRTVTKLWCIGIKELDVEGTTVYADQPGYPKLSAAIKRLKAAEKVVFHNALGYDFPVINQFYPGTLRFDQVYDTLVVSRLRDPENKFMHSMEAWGKKFGMFKVEHEEWDRFSPEMANRCKTDVELGERIYKAVTQHMDRWGESVALEHQVANVIHMQEWNGFVLDLKAANELVGVLRQEQTNLATELQETFPPRWVKGDEVTPKGDNARFGYVKGVPFTKVEYEEFNPGSRKQIASRLQAKGWVPNKFTNSGAVEVDETILEELALKWPEAAKLSRYFRVSKELGQIADGDKAWLKLFTKDSRGEARVHGKVNPNGTVTGRMSHFDPNLGNVDKKDMRMRAVWKARKGWKLVGSDAEGLELRMLGHYLAAYDNGEFSTALVQGDKSKGTDPHSINQRLIGLFKRDNAKRVIYALIYGAGDKKLGLIIVEDADEAKKPRPRVEGMKVVQGDRYLRALGKQARAALMQGVKGFKELSEKVRATARTRKALRGLDGRYIPVRAEYSALNTLLQGGGAAVMKKALAIFHYELAVEAGFVSKDFTTTENMAYCANVHDEVQIEAHPKVAAKVGELFKMAITMAGERLKVRCPLSGSADYGDSWAATH